MSVRARPTRVGAGVLTELYLHSISGELISIHRRRGFGPSALPKEIGKLGVFFHHGDGPGLAWQRHLLPERPLLQRAPDRGSAGDVGEWPTDRYGRLQLLGQPERLRRAVPLSTAGDRA